MGIQMIELRDISFSYGKRTILKNLSVSAAAGECIVLAGPNGSGKSTALSIMAGVLRPDSGSVSVEGTVGFAPQGTALFEDMTAEDNLRFFAGLRKCAVPHDVPFGVERYLKTRVSKLSGGMKKQVSIACALLGDPDIVLLDEPCESLDVEYREELVQLVSGIKARGGVVIYVGHEPMEFASFYDRLIFFGNGNAEYTRMQLSGNPADHSRLCNQFVNLFKREENLRER